MSSPTQDRPGPDLTPASPSQTRSLLRALRDVNSTCRLHLDGDEAVSLEGCQSLDQPVEQGVRYRLRLADGSKRLLTIDAMGQDLQLALLPTGSGPSEVERRAEDRLWRDSQGNAVALGLRARWRKGHTGPVPAERFLRRVVRGLFAA